MNKEYVLLMIKTHGVERIKNLLKDILVGAERVEAYESAQRYKEIFEEAINEYEQGALMTKDIL